MRFLLFAFAALVSADTVAAESPIDVGVRKQLFIDNRFIAQSDGVALRMNPPQKLGLVRDEHGQPLTGHISRVIDDQGKIRLYLGAESLTLWEGDDPTRFRNTGTTIPGGNLLTILLDRHDPDPARRYKLFGLKAKEPFDRTTDGIYASYSGDGVHFTSAGRVLPFLIDNPTIVDWDERVGKYVIFTRAFAYGSESQRRIGRIETDDPMKSWPYRESTKSYDRFSTEHAQVVLEADSGDDPFSDIYYNAATLYPAAQDVYLMFTAQFRHFSPQRQPFLRPRQPGGWEDYGLLEVQMAVSRDGLQWQRPSREPYVPNGLADEWDRWYTVMGPGMVRRGNYLYQYYYSTGRTHDSAILRQEYRDAANPMGGIGVVRQRLDGFVSADADHRGGWLKTPLLTFRGKVLRLNVDSGAMGTAFVELRDANDRPIPDFTLAESEEIGGNFIDQRVCWKGRSDVSALAGKPVRLYFRLTRTKLYSFQFVDE